MRKLLPLLIVALLAQITFAQTRPALPKSVIAKYDVVYAHAGKSDLLMDIFMPAGKTKVPMVVSIHGGGWKLGSKENCPILFLLNRGYAVASINYRLTTEATWPAQIYDCKAAIRYLRAHADDYSIDPDHIGVAGSSAGGHLVALMGTTNDNKELEGDEGNLNVSSRVQAVVDYYGPTDLLMVLNGVTDVKAEKADHDFLRLFLGGEIETHQEQAKAASPMTYVSADASPFLIVHGTADPLVPYSQSVKLNDALKKAGVESTLITVEGGGHGSGAGFHSAETAKAVVDFLDKHLKQK